MWPTIVSVGPIAVHSFGLLMALGIFFGGFVFWKKGREEGFDEEKLMDSWLQSGIWALIAGRVWYVLANWSWFEKSWYKMIFLTKFPGLSYQGVLIGVLLSLWLFALRNKQNVWLLMESAIFGLLLTELFGWIGSFLAGSSLGKETSGFWGIRLPSAEMSRQPTQLIACLWVLVTYWLMKKWEKEYRSFKWYQKKGEAETGFLLVVYFVSLGCLRIVLDFLQVRGVEWWFAVGMVLVGTLILVSRIGINIKPDKIKVGESGDANMIKEKERKIVKKIKSRKKKGFDFK